MAKKTDYKKLFDKEQTKFEKEKTKKNPDGRLSWNKLLQMFYVIEGIQPGGQGRPDPNAIINRDFRECGLISAKLKTNSTEIKEKFFILDGIKPTFKDEKEFEKFNEKRKSLLEEYFKTENLAQFSENELRQLAGGQDKLDSFNGKFEQLKADFPKVAEYIKELNDFKNQPLAKCEFDVITKDETRRAPVKPNEWQVLDPMTDF